MSRETLATISLLVVEDDRSLREGCATTLQVEGYRVTSCGRGDEALEALARGKFDIVLVDWYMTPVAGPEILQAALAANPASQVIIMTGRPTVASSIEAQRAGAFDYLPKPFSGTHLQLLVGRAAFSVLGARTRDAVAADDADGTTADGWNPGGQLSILGVSPAFRRAVQLARKVAATSASVMLVGESGTGKELLAQFIHRNSQRAKHALVPLNCAAMPEHLLESEMFGHRKGAFTGADRDKQGLFEIANGGTFFLDELVEMPMPLQAKLLRVIQDGVVRRVGSEHAETTVDVRFISATNADPRDAIQARTLRADLFYRLSVVPITLPPLRNRLEDIPLLANHFLAHFWKKHRPSRAPLPHFGDTTIEFLQSRPWRGNFRELQNTIEHLAVLAQPGGEVVPEDIPATQEWVGGGKGAGDWPVEPQKPVLDAYHLAKEQVLTKFEKEYVTRLVARAAGNMSRAARIANVDRTTLYRLLERHGVRRESVED